MSIEKYLAISCEKWVSVIYSFYYKTNNSPLPNLLNMSTGRFTEIADRFSVSSQAITNLKKRRKDEWDALIAGLTTADLKELAETVWLQSRLSDKETRANNSPTSDLKPLRFKG